MKKLISVILCLAILSTIAVTAYASDVAVPYSNNVYTVDVSFSITSNGKATVSYEYRGKSGVTKSAKVVTKVQKKFGLIWITVDDGNWTDTSTAVNFSQSHSVQLSKTGTYRAHVEFTISGTGGSDDKITKKIEKTYS